ncbi:hypothetical protein K227x_44040 [Rubripirellula lacrimiformis]|uniref:Uncharacterized protein n=1 Tax=Rubripirellula lacrimiformis TaxID=1930273 RepID=A0A517NFT9_9BACT|nr:hypothetical protein [Rubripirellula lacrimiformis]QDT05997.1 hypothetical protein K227x_44040 [Rubripirellula lacrimiformis]
MIRLGWCRKKVSTAFLVGLAVAFLLAAGVVGLPAQAADSIIGDQMPPVQFPNSGGKTAGFRCDLVFGRVPSVGYVPVEITLTATGTFPADRQFVIRITTSKTGNAPPAGGLRIDLPIGVDQGARTVSVKRYFPKWNVGESLDIAVLENGRPLEDYATSIGQNLPGSAYRFHQVCGTERSINWCLISSDDVVTVQTIPDIRPVIVDLVDNGDFPDKAADPSFWSEMINNSWMSAIGQSELPTDWRSYSQHDVVLVSPETIDRIRSNRDAFAALRQWVLIGGTLVVYEAPTPKACFEALRFPWDPDPSMDRQVRLYANQVQGQANGSQASQASELQALQTLIQVLQRTGRKTLNVADVADVVRQNAAAPTLDNDIEMDAEMGGFTDQIGNDPAAPTNGMLPSSIRVESNGQEYWFDNDLKSAIEAEAKLSELIRAAKQTSQVLKAADSSIYFQPVGAGRVVAINDGVDDPASRLRWAVVRRMLGYRISPMLRNGVDPMLGDQRFDRWLIPGVAQPPVYTFMGLLVGFVILVGPVAYRKTAKAGRSYLMFAIAPVLATLTTVAMFSYGIISDGFGSTARVRQITLVTGDTGDGGERVRASYFAGVRPSDGIRFPAESEVMQYPENSDRSWRQAFRRSASIIGDVTIDDVSQRFDASFLPSRQQRQFVLHLPRPGIGRLELNRLDDTGSMEIKNGFGFPLSIALARGSDGNYWAALRLAAGKTQEARPIRTRLAAQILGKMYNDYRPISVTKQSNASYRNYSSEIFDLLADINRSFESGNMTTEGTFEKQLQQSLQTDGELPKGSFIALAAPSSDVIAIPNAQLVDSVRYVLGTLPSAPSPDDK